MNQGFKAHARGREWVYRKGAARDNLTANDLQSTMFAYPDRRLGRGLHAQEFDMILESIITCPHCATAKVEPMPADACQVFYECSSCGAILRPKQGDCCVFCSYGSVPCPPIQAERLDGHG